MSERDLLPVVGLPCDRHLSSGHQFHRAGEKYIDAVRGAAHALPVLLPVLDPPLPAARLLAAVDGLLFTGSPSNVAPHRYGGPTARETTLLDEARDETTLPLLRAAIEAGVPVLAICRGFQEMNVALGGTLHQNVEEIPGFADHRAPKDKGLDEQYGPSHSVALSEGGVLAALTGERCLIVNSLHSQGINRLAPGLAVEARADDGVVEAVSLPHVKGFVLGVQWHPEWRYAESAASQAIFGAFGDAVCVYARKKSSA